MIGRVNAIELIGDDPFVLQAGTLAPKDPVHAIAYGPAGEFMEGARYVVLKNRGLILPCSLLAAIS